MSVLVDVHGSCVSRSAFNFIDESKIKVKHLFSRNNIASSMMPPCSLDFEHGALVQYTSEYSERCMRYALNKKNIDVLMESDAEYLFVDFFDFCQPVAGYQDTTFSTYDYTFYNTNVYKENVSDFLRIDFMSLPHCLWYGYVDAYFKIVTEKFAGKVVLNRLNCSSVFMSQDKQVLPIPERLCHFGSAKYNKELAALEEYIIKKYPNIYVTDVTKYFIPDYAHNPDTTPVHFEKNFGILLSDIFERIVSGDPRHYYDTMPAEMVAELLSRPVSMVDFLKIYEERELPFSSGSYLDFIFKQMNLLDIANNREWIAFLYKEYARFEGDIEQLTSSTELWMDMTSFKKSVYGVLKEVGACLSLSVSQLYQEFLEHFENSMPEKWMIELNVLAVVAPNYEQMSDYLLEYYNAIEDDTAFLKTCLNTY